MRIVNFGFSLPPTSSILGIQLTIAKYASTGNFYGVTDKEITLGYNNNTIGSNKKKSGNWRTTVTNSTYGNATDLWDALLTPQMLNDPWFGVYITASYFMISSCKLICRGSSGPTITAYIDYALLDVFYGTNKKYTHPIDDGIVTTNLVTTGLITTMEVTSGAITTGITTSELTSATIELPVTTEAIVYYLCIP